MFLGHDKKLISDKKMIFIFNQRNKEGSKNYSSHFSASFETTIKFPIVFLRLVFGKVRVDGHTGTRREIDVNK